MYDEDEDLWTGNGLSKQIAAERLAAQQATERATANKPSAMDRVSGGIKGAMSGASTGAEIGGPWGAAIGGVLGAGLGAVAANKSEKAPMASELGGGVKTAKGLLDSDKIKALKEVADNPMLDLSDADLAP
jgi:uncharacterized membrane protein